MSAEANSCLGRFHGHGVGYGVLSPPSLTWSYHIADSLPPMINVRPPRGMIGGGTTGLCAHLWSSGFRHEVQLRILLGTHAVSAQRP